jgi:hypothetical protein
MDNAIEAADLGKKKPQKLRKLQTRGQPLGEALDEAVRHSRFQQVRPHLENHKTPPYSSNFLILPTNGGRFATGGQTAEKGVKGRPG